MGAARGASSAATAIPTAGNSWYFPAFQQCRAAEAPGCPHVSRRMHGMNRHRNEPRLALSRRTFTALVAGAAATAARPASARIRRLAGETIVGEGPHAFRVKHNFPQLPDRFTWQTTHNVAVDSAGNLYVIHEGNKDKKDHPAIFVFDAEGKFIRAFGSEFQGGGHGIEVRKEGNEEFLYVCGYQGVKAFAKMTPTGLGLSFSGARCDHRRASGKGRRNPSWALANFLLGMLRSWEAAQRGGAHPILGRFCACAFLV